jgi:formate-dependent nitrite reductase membrane component NrfD
MTNAEGRMSNETPSMKFKLGVVTLVFALVGGFWLWIFWMGIHQAGESIRALPKEAAKAIEAAAVLQSGR